MKYQYRHHPSKLATLVVTYGGGSRAEFQRQFPAGIAHFMEHFRFKGTAKYNSKDLTRKVAFYGGAWNAFTSEDLVSYHISIPDENLEQAFEYLSQITLYPTFPEHELGREKEVVCQEVRMYEDDINDRAHWHMKGRIFKNGLGRNICGTEDTVQAITQNDLLRFNDSFYSPEHMLVTLVSQNDRRDLVEKYFSIPDDVLVYPPADINPSYGEGFSGSVHKDGIIQDSILISFGGPDVYSTEKRAVCKVFNSVFGGADDARLFMRLRDDMGLVYGIYSHMANNMDGALFTIGTQTEPENTATVLSLVDEEISRMVDTKPTDEEMQRAKNRIRSSEYMSVDSSHGVAMKALYEEFYGLSSGSKYLTAIDAVTADEVQAFAKELFSSNKYTVIGTSKEKENGKSN